MPSFAFNAHVDQIGYYARLPDSGSSWIAVLLRSAGLESDDVLADYADLAALLLATNDEAIFANYSRKPTTPARVVRNTTNDVLLSVSNVVYTQAGSSTGGQNDTVEKALLCYKPAASATDAQIKPLIASQIRATTDGNDMTLRNPNGLVVVTSVQAA